MLDGAQLRLLPRSLDPRKMAQLHAKYAGAVPLDAMSRMAGACHQVVGVHADLHFYIDDSGKRCVRGEIEAELELICQRCLKPMHSTLHSALNLAVVSSEEQAENLSSDLDPWLVEETEADLYYILEEELLLDLPVVSYHSGECIDPALLVSGEAANVSNESTNKPFDVLKDLKEQMKSQPKS